MVTAYDVATLAGVSIGTVSRYLTGNGYVGETSRTKIAAAVAELGYVHNRTAASLKTRKTGLIGFVVSDLRNPFTAEVAAAINHYARTHGYGVVLSDSMADPTVAIEAIDLLRSHDVDGIIITPPESPELEAAILAAIRHVPIVGIGLRTEPMSIDLVTVDTYTGSRTAVDYLAGLGHRDIAFIGSATMASGRYRGYEDSLIEHGIPVRESLVEVGPLNRDFGFDAMTALLDQHPRPTAIFAVNDATALGVVQAAHRHHLRVPDDLSVVGYDDVDLAAHSTPPLTTVAQPIRRLGEEAVRLMLDRLSGTADDTPTEVRLDSELIIRESCAPLA
ncbi:LacI family DNA-binding transcriptional regulator [Ruania alba]|uniref:Transcriptional regulator, LacI family n=1 Tax=Ruania alba TaxID=648782 RepID=A0A1H5GZB4_9MICO|nr:LacI family DNA-binding transcriptional regulator [Ruania alba]SEE20368.1 transcriptional regulator, LacI family [Ruania alba]